MCLDTIRNGRYKPGQEPCRKDENGMSNTRFIMLCATGFKLPTQIGEAVDIDYSLPRYSNTVERYLDH